MILAIWSNEKRGLRGNSLDAIAIADVDQDVRLEPPVGEEFRVDLGVVEAGHRAGVEADRAQREDQIGDLQSAVLEARRALAKASLLVNHGLTSACGNRNGRCS